MKKGLLAFTVFMVVTSMTLLSTTLCLAQFDRTVTNTSKKGSLLVWPLIKSGAPDTTIQLTNNYYAPVKVKCFYGAKFPASHTSWGFTMLPNQTIAWRASTGKGPDGRIMPGVNGTPPALAAGVACLLSCWAVDSGGTQQIAWNWLSGDAIVGESGNQYWEYSAWRFAVNSSTTGANAGTAGKLQLTGDSGNYDACPTGLLFNFLKQTTNASQSFPPGNANTRLTLVPCGQDLATDNNPVVYASMGPRDEVSTPLSSTYVCVGSQNSTSQWYSESLLSTKMHIIGSTINPYTNIASPGGNIYIHGKQETGSCVDSMGVPLIGVMSMQLSSSTGPVVGATPTGIGPGQAYIKDGNDANTSTPIVINSN